MSALDRSDVLLEVRDLSVGFSVGGEHVDVVDGVTFDVRPGEVMGLVGESGSGKTVTSLAVAGLVPQVGGTISGGVVRFDGHHILDYSRLQRSNLLGRDIGMIFQQPIRSLNPTMKVGDQIAEVVRRHERLSKGEARRRAVEMLDRVQIPKAEERARDYPHTFSGGMAQRAMIAMALVCRPKLLIADEPTTALDVTVQATVLDLIRDLQREMGMAVVLITHDLGVVAKVCHTVSVMYSGQLVESGPVDQVLGHPRHPYTAGLLGAMHRRGVKGRPIAVPGMVPPPHDLPTGCRFHPRCGYALEGRCDVTEPDLVPSSDERADRCLRSTELEGVLVAAPRAVRPPTGDDDLEVSR